MGRDEKGIAAVLAWRPDQSILIDVAARANRTRNLGSRPTREMVDRAQAQVMGRGLARQRRSVDVGAVIHTNNVASRYFAGRFEMEVIRDVDDDDDHLLCGITRDAAPG